MADIATFKVQFPEFALAGDPLLTAMLGSATLEHDATVWLSMTDQGIYYRMAHKLAISPYGNAAKLSTANGTSTYGATWQEMLLMVTAGVSRVT